jgi:hypothetical protein
VDVQARLPARRIIGTTFQHGERRMSGSKRHAVRTGLSYIAKRWHSPKKNTVDYGEPVARATAEPKQPTRKGAIGLGSIIQSMRERRQAAIA